MKKRTWNKNRGILLAEALMGLTVLTVVVAAAMQTMQNAQRWLKQSEQKKFLAEDAELLWLEIQTGQSLRPVSPRNERRWTIAPLVIAGGFPLLRLSAENGDDFYVAAPK